MLFFCSFYSLKILEKMIMAFTKTLSSRTVFNIDNNKNLEHPISISEWFLKDHVTLKTVVMMLKIHRNNYIWKYSVLLCVFTVFLIK